MNVKMGFIRNLVLLGIGISVMLSAPIGAYAQTVDSEVEVTTDVEYEEQDDFQAPVTTDSAVSLSIELLEVIEEAEELYNDAISETNKYPQEALDKLLEAIGAAKELVQIEDVGEAELIEAISHLKMAISEFRASVITLSLVTGDVNGDGVVNVADLGLVAFYYETKEGGDNWENAIKADIDEDGEIDMDDITIVAEIIIRGE